MNWVLTSIKDINELQENIMKFVIDWVKDKNTPVPRANIIADMEDRGTKTFTTINALNSLLKKGYIRRTRISKSTSYIQLRGI